MTTLIVDIEKAEDLEAAKSFFAERGLNYEVNDEHYQDFVYTDEIKQMLDEREADYLSGKDIPITVEESRRRIEVILNRKP